MNSLLPRAAFGPWEVSNSPAVARSGFSGSLVGRLLRLHPLGREFCSGKRPQPAEPGNPRPGQPCTIQSWLNREAAELAMKRRRFLTGIPSPHASSSPRTLSRKTVTVNRRGKCIRSHLIFNIVSIVCLFNTIYICLLPSRSLQSWNIPLI